MRWWMWFALGLVLAGLELAGPGGFYIIFFGVAGVLVGVLALAGLAGPTWVQWVLFSALSIASLLLFRNPLLRRLELVSPPRAAIDDLTGEIATPQGDIAPGAVGRAELRGAIWTARNAGQTTLRQGERCRVLRVDGLMIHITPEGAV